MRAPLLVVVCAFASSFFTSPALAQTSPQLELTQDQQAELRAIAVKLLNNADKANCTLGSCKILVMNFVTDLGNTSVFGMRLADAFSEQLRTNANGIAIADRTELQHLLESEKISSKLLKDHNVARWLAMKLDANAVVLATLKPETRKLHISALLLDAHRLIRVPRTWRDPAPEPEAVFRTVSTLGSFENSVDLSPTEPFTLETTNVPRSEVGESPQQHEPTMKDEVYPAGINGVGKPSCYFTPQPKYTDAAEDSHFQGDLSMSVTITKKGKVQDLHMISGAPFGLNDVSRTIVKTWKCHPALLNGKSVSSTVPVAITFRLF